MSESKRRRKSKHEVRNIFDFEESENTILQLARNRKDPDVLDHTYARYTPGLQFSIQVEVEPLDERLLEVPRVKNSKSIYIFKVDVESMFSIATNIYNTSTNLADKCLSIELRNIWGRLLKSDIKCDPINSLIQEALGEWALSAQSQNYNLYDRDPPLFYQCLPCQQAWWYLTPFQEHLITYKHNNIKVFFQSNNVECNIVASDVAINQPKYIKCAGNCYRCGNTFRFHNKTVHLSYICRKCKEKFDTCSRIRKHKAVCLDLDSPTSESVPKFGCILCSEPFLSKKELHEHMRLYHLVRSDIPCLSETCKSCNKLYFDSSTHVCRRSKNVWLFCQYCQRQFQLKTLQMLHHEIQKPFVCEICDECLPASCMKADHMLTHCNRYMKVYKCLSADCPPVFLFPDERSVKLHKTLYHKKQYDKRRPFFEKVLIPKECFSTDYVQVIESCGEAKGIQITKIKNEQTDTQVEDWCISNAGAQTDIQTDSQTDVSEQDDDLIIIDQELKEMETIEILSNDDNDSNDDDDGDSYAGILSKVFQVSEAVKDSTFIKQEEEEIPTKIKTEPLDIKYESHNVTINEIKQEPIEECLGEAFLAQTVICQPDRYQPASNQTDSCQPSTSRTQTDSCHPDRYQPASNLTDSCQPSTSRTQTDSFQPSSSRTQTDSCHPDRYQPASNLTDSCQPSTSRTQTDSCHLDRLKNNNKQIILDTNQIDTSDVTSVRLNDVNVDVKIEPEDEFEEIFDSDITAVKLEPQEVETEMYVMDDTHNGELMDVEEFLKKNEEEIRNPNSLLKAEIVKAKNPKSLLKHNYIDEKMKIIKKKGKNAVLDDKVKRLYSCKCGFSSTHKMFRLHQPSCQGKDNTPWCLISCTKCAINYISLKAYLLHFPQHGFELNQCPICKLMFEYVKDLVPHFQRHVKHSYVNYWVIGVNIKLSKKQHRCQTCREIVKSEDYYTHWESHFSVNVEQPAPVHPEKPKSNTSNDDEVITSDGVNMLKPDVLNALLAELRKDTREKFCLYCRRRFNRRHDLKRHLIEHLLADAIVKKMNSSSLRLRCQICAEEHARPEQYKFHMREHGGLPVYCCGLCDKTFSDSSNFAKHKKMHNMKVLICDICLKKFHAKSYLEKHIMWHMETDPVDCDECGKSFFTVSSLNRHKKSRHGPGSSFRCVHCDMSFECLRDKWDHAWMVHRERKNKADCPICGQEFRKRVDVKQHARSEHNVTLSYYNIKSENGEVHQVKIFCKVADKNLGTSQIPKPVNLLPPNEMEPSVEQHLS